MNDLAVTAIMLVVPTLGFGIRAWRWPSQRPFAVNAWCVTIAIVTLVTSTYELVKLQLR